MFVFAFFSAVCSRPRHHELVAGAPPACLLAREDAVLHQVADIPQGGVLGAFADEGPLRGGQFAFKAIQQAVEQEPLTAVEGLARVRLPEPRLGQHGLQRHLRALDRALEAAQEPFDPYRHVQRSLLALLQHIVVGRALLLDLRRQAVEPLRTAFRPGQHQVGDRPRDPTVAVIEGVNRDEP